MRIWTDSIRRSLQASFRNLPKPENNFKLQVPNDKGEDESESGKVLSDEDAAVRDAGIKRQKEKERAALARRSEVMKRGLPRPPNVDLGRLLKDLSPIPAPENDPGSSSAAHSHRVRPTHAARLAGAPNSWDREPRWNS